MWRFTIVALAVTCLVLLGWYAVKKYPRRIEASLQARAQKVLDTKVPGVKVSFTMRDAELAGSVPSDADRATAEALVADLSGVKSVTNRVVTAQPVPPAPEVPKEATLALDIKWTGSVIELSGEVPAELITVLDRKMLIAFDTENIPVTKTLTETQGKPPEGAEPALSAAVDALGLGIEGSAKVRGKAVTLDMKVRDAALSSKIEEIAGKVDADLTVAIDAPAAEAAPDAAADAAAEAVAEAAAEPDVAAEAEVAAVEVVAEVAADTAPAPEVVADTGPSSEVGPSDAAVVPPSDAVTVVDPGGALTPKQCKDLIGAAIDREKRITFKGPTGRLSDEGDKKVQEVAQLLLRCPTATGRIEGHHDDYGEPDELKRLTTIRAYNVWKRLKELGVEEKRFKYAGLGYHQLKYKGKERLLNQRVEFNITVE